jgi:CHAT domain-containing protein
MRESPTARARAAEAYALVESNPRRALELARQALDVAVSEGDPRAEVAARHALGWAQHAVGDAKSARATLNAGIRLAERHGDRQGEGLLRRHLAYQLAINGEVRAARREIDAAIELLTGIERARSQVHRLAVHRAAHPVDSPAHRRVLADAARAVATLRRRGDEIWEAQLLRNRGGLFFDRGELDRAEDDFARAHLLFERAGAHAAAADESAALAEVALLRGEIVDCLQRLDRVEAELPEGHTIGTFDECRVMALAEARLLPEARTAAEAYVELCRRTGRADAAPAAMLDLAEIDLMLGDWETSDRLARGAMRSLAAAGKPLNAALAKSASLRARLAGGRADVASTRKALQAADVLERGGWRREELRARLVAARIAIAAGAPAPARAQLALAAPLSRLGMVADRVDLCHADALVRLADGDQRGAERALTRALGLVEAHRAALGAMELRVTASELGREPAELGVRIALASHRPAKVLTWAERLRGNALRLPPVRPPTDSRLRRLLTELRRVRAEARSAEADGKIARGSAAQQAELEARIRAYTRLTDAAGATPGELPPLAGLERSLAGRVLVEYVESDGQLVAITLAGRRLALHELGPAGAATQELDWLRFALRSKKDRETKRQNLAASSAALDRMLIEPLLSELGDAELLLVPTGELHVIPWAVLPSLHGRPVSIAPSLTIWLDLMARPRPRRRRTVLVAGPRLRHATPEIHELAAILPAAHVLTGDEATVEATLKELGGASLAHIACHGDFRADSPLFSALELADGLLNVYELQQLKRVPDVVVLSACDLALSGLHPGDELLGLAAALIGMGTSTVVASVVPVGDAAARHAMVRFHRALAAGSSPATALAQAQTESRVPGFVCLGRG